MIKIEFGLDSQDIWNLRCLVGWIMRYYHNNQDIFGHCKHELEKHLLPQHPWLNISALKSQLSNAKKDLENTKRKLNEVSEKFMERNRQHSKLQVLNSLFAGVYFMISEISGELVLLKTLVVRSQIKKKLNLKRFKV